MHPRDCPGEKRISQDETDFAPKSVFGRRPLQLKHPTDDRKLEGGHAAPDFSHI